MARKKTNEIAVGLFTLMALGLLLSLVFLMGGLDGLWRENTEVWSRFSDVQGLQPGDPVYLFGLRVGSVRCIDLLPPKAEQPAELAVCLVFPKTYRRYLRANTPVKIDKSLTGSISVLILETDDGKGAPFPDGEDVFLRGSPAVDFRYIADEFHDVLEKGKEAVATVNGLISSIKEKGDLEAAIADVALLAKEVREDLVPATESLKGTIRSIDETLVSFKELLKHNETKIDDILTNLKDSSVLAKGILGDLQETPAKLDSGLKSLEGASDEIARLVADNRVHVDVILEDLRQTVTNAEGLTTEIKRRPWRLLYKPDEDELEANELYDAAWAYNLGSTELYRTLRVLTDRVKAAGEADQDPELLKEALERVRLSLDEQRKAEETFWARLKERQ